MNGETIAMIKALQAKSIEELKTSGGSSDAGKVLAVGSDGRIAPIDLPVGEGQIALDGTLTIHGAAAGAKETGDAIRSLNGSLEMIDELNADGTDKGYMRLKNLFDPSADNSTTGYYSRTNTFTQSSKLLSTDYVPVVAGRTITIGTRNTFCTAYDENKNFVKYINSEVSSSNPSQYTITDGIAYCRFICAASGMTPSFPNYRGFYIYDGSYEYVSLDDVVADAVSRADNPWDGMSAVAFGTSLTYRAQTTGGYLQYLPTLSGISFDNQGIGGSMIFADGSNLDMLAAIKAYTGYASKDLCIIEGFVNDWAHTALGSYTDTTETSACGCLYSAISYIYTQNPDIQIVVIIDHFTKGETWPPTKVINSQTQMSYYAEIKKLCNLYGIPVIDECKSEISMFNPQYYLDHVHLNALGAEQSAKFIWSKLKYMAIKVKDGEDMNTSNLLANRADMDVFDSSLAPTDVSDDLMN